MGLWIVRNQFLHTNRCSIYALSHRIDKLHHHISPYKEPLNCDQPNKYNSKNIPCIRCNRANGISSRSICELHHPSYNSSGEITTQLQFIRIRSNEWNYLLWNLRKRDKNGEKTFVCSISSCCCFDEQFLFLFCFHWNYRCYFVKGLFWSSHHFWVRSLGSESASKTWLNYFAHHSRWKCQCLFTPSDCHSAENQSIREAKRSKPFI